MLKSSSDCGVVCSLDGRSPQAVREFLDLLTQKTSLPLVVRGDLDMLSLDILKKHLTQKYHDGIRIGVVDQRSAVDL